MKILKLTIVTGVILLNSLLIKSQDCVHYTVVQNNIGPASETFGVSLADFDGDDYKDVVIIDAYDDIEIYFNNGDGSFNTTAYSLGGIDRDRFGVQVLDIENDGDMDFVVTPFYSESWGCEIWENDGSGIFSLKQDDIGTHTYGEELAVGDLNNDGYIDIFYPHRYGIEVFLNNGSGTFNSNGQDLETSSEVTETNLKDYNLPLISIILFLKRPQKMLDI